MIVGSDKKFIQYSSYLFYLIPVFLIKFIFFADLFLIFVDIIFLYFVFKYKKYNYFSNFYFKFFLFFYLLLVIRSLFSDDINLSFGNSIFYLRFLLFSLATIFFLDHNKIFLCVLRRFFIIILLILLFDTIFQYFFTHNIFGMEYRYFNDDNFRLTSIFGRRGVLGSYIARFFPFIIALFFIGRKNLLTTKDLLIIILICLISTILVILSGERTSIVLLIFGFTLIFFTSNGKLKKIFKYLLIPIVLISILIISLDARIKNRILSHSFSQLGLNSPKEKIYIFGEVYEGHFKVAYKMFRSNPIFGQGVKMFRVFCSKKENYVSETACTTHPHHTYVQLLAETGLLGFFFIFSIFVLISFILLKSFFFNFFQKKKISLFISNYNNAKICLLTSIFLTLSPFNPSGNFFNNWLSIIYFFPIGFLFYLENLKSTKEHKKF